MKKKKYLIFVLVLLLLTIFILLYKEPIEKVKENEIKSNFVTESYKTPDSFWPDIDSLKVKDLHYDDLGIKLKVIEGWSINRTSETSNSEVIDRIEITQGEYQVKIYATNRDLTDQSNGGIIDFGELKKYNVVNNMEYVFGFEKINRSYPSPYGFGQVIFLGPNEDAATYEVVYSDFFYNSKVSSNVTFFIEALSSEDKLAKEITFILANINLAN